MKPNGQATRSRRLTVKTRLACFAMVLVIPAVGASLFFAYQLRRDALEEGIAKELLALVNSVAPLIDGELHDAISASTHGGIAHRDAFDDIRRQLSRVKAANGLAGPPSPLYTLRKTEDFAQSGELEFVVMTDPDESGRFFVGNRYRIRPHLAQALAGQATCTRAYHDEEGAWISAAAPIHSDSGEIVGVLQSDRTITHFHQALFRQTMTLGGAGLVTVLIASLLAIALSRTLVHPLTKLTTAARQVADGDFLLEVDTSRNDELGDLARAFGAMTRSLRYRDGILTSLRLIADELLAGNEHSVPGRVALIRLRDAVGATSVIVGQDNADGISVLRFVGRSGDGALAAVPVPAPIIDWSRSAFREWRTRLERSELVALTAGEAGQLLPALTDGIAPMEAAVLPLIAGDRPWGVLIFLAASGGAGWGQTEQSCFRAVASMLGAAIHRVEVNLALIQTNETLERRVAERTDELQREVKEREFALEQLAETQQSLVRASRLAGMSEIATSILHNVGNVLNSINVSAGLVIDTIRDSRLTSLLKGIELVRQHQDDLAAFLDKDPKGRKLPGFLELAARQVALEHETVRKELQQLQSNVDHTKQIVSAQQGYARVSGVVEKLELAAVVEDALTLSAATPGPGSIEIVRAFEKVPEVITDRHKVLQILTNLINNARQALAPSPGPHRIVIRIQAVVATDLIRIEVSDNGPGIAPENLVRIFQHGFTTKKSGHGFGLHACAIAAKELGGSLDVQSADCGQGAAFILELPIRKAAAEPNPRVADDSDRGDDPAGKSLDNRRHKAA